MKINWTLIDKKINDDIKKKKFLRVKEQ